MKEFLKYTLATVTGLVIAGIVLVIIGVGMLVGMAASFSSSTPVSVDDNSLVVIRLEGELTEQPQPLTLQTLTSQGGTDLTLQQLLDVIAYAQSSDKVKGICLTAGSFAAPPAALEELRGALERFKDSGKFITAYADSYSQGTYYVCSLADRVMLNPVGDMTWEGMSTEVMFYKNLLEKAGVEVQIFKVGTYKSAVEPYAATQMSEANREQTTAFLQSIWNGVVGGVAAARDIAPDTLQAYADRLLSAAPARELVACRLVDTLIYRNDVEDDINQRYNTDKKDFRLVEAADLVSLATSQALKASHPQIAVYYAEGGIDDATSGRGDGNIHAPLMCEDLRKLAEDEKVKAVVLRVNSPGGSAFGSEQIWHEVMNLKARKPVIVSMGGYAASGGYYISCAADSIVADPGTLTGSIGIFGMIPNFKGVADKVGITFDGVSTNRHGGASLFRPLDDAQRTGMQANIERGYALFVQRCADGRGLSTDSIRRIAEGRVWTGEMAKRIGLVDELGGIDTAIRLAAEKAGLTEYSLTRHPAPAEWWDMLMNNSWGGFVQAELRDLLGSDYESLQFVKHIRQQAPVQARLPYVLRLNL